MSTARAEPFELESLGECSHPMADAVWRQYVAGKSTRQIAKELGSISHTQAWRLITQRTAELQQVHSAEHKAACVGMLLERYGDLYETVTQMLDTVDSPQAASVLVACGVKINQEVAKIHGLSGEMAASDLNNLQRMSQVAERMRLIGPHARMPKQTAETALKLAGISTPEINPEAITIDSEPSSRKTSTNGHAFTIE